MKIKKILPLFACLALLLSYLPVAKAASLTSLKDTLTNSAPTVVSNHTFDFNVPSAISGDDAEIDITWPASPDFTISSIAFGDVDVELDGVDQTVVDGDAPAATEVGYELNDRVMTFHFGSSVSLGAGDSVKIEIGTNAAGGTNQITNPTPAGSSQSYQIAVGAYDTDADVSDTGTLSVNINSSIQVTATVQSSLTFAIAGIASGAGNCPNSSAAGTADITTTSTSIPFGSMTVDVAKVGCQRLTVSTNASGGYVVTVQQNQNLTSAAAKTIDAFKGADGNANTYTTPEVWAQPKDATPTTHKGYFGFTSDDTDAHTGLYDSYKFAGYQANDTPYEVARASGSVSGEEDIVSYKLEVTNLQEAGIYSNTLMYICTATF